MTYTIEVDILDQNIEIDASILDTTSIQYAVEIIRVLKGDTGAQGNTGPQGPSGVGTPFEQSFTASAQWIVNHNLGRSPSTVRVLSPGGVEVEADILEINNNQIIASFISDYSGKIIIF